MVKSPRFSHRGVDCVHAGFREQAVWRLNPFKM